MEDAVYVFTTVPSSDTHSAGALLGASYATHGSGSVTDLYTTGDLGITNSAAFLPDSAIGAAFSDALDLPLVGVVDGTNSALDAVYGSATAGWTTKFGGNLPSNAVPGSAIAVVSVPANNIGLGDNVYDSLFTVGSIGDLDEYKLRNNGSWSLMTPRSLGNNGTALDSTTASLAASWYTTSGNNRAVAYARRDSTHGDAVFSDWVNNTQSWSGFFSGGDLDNATYHFDGLQIVMRHGSDSEDSLVAVCEDSASIQALGHMDRTFGATTQTWTLVPGW